MRIRLLDVPLDFGANLRGVDLGPTALRRAGLKETLSALGHEIEEDPGLVPIPIAEHRETGDPRVRFLEPVAEVCRSLASRVEIACREGAFPLVLGGDHSLALGSLAGLKAYYQQKPWGVIWIDAHADFNTPETSPSGNIHGMSLAASCGLGHPLLTMLYGPSPKVHPHQVVVVGVRDLDPGEKLNLKQAGVKVFTMADIDRWGMAEIALKVRQVLEPQTDWHVSLDIDVLDPGTAPGVGTPVPGGLTYRELHLLLESLAETQRVTSADVVEVNPILDTKNQTASVAVAMVRSLLGATIL